MTHHMRMGVEEGGRLSATKSPVRGDICCSREDEFLSYPQEEKHLWAPGFPTTNSTNIVIHEFYANISV